MFALSPLASFAIALVCAIALESGGAAGEGSGSGSYTSYWEFEEWDYSYSYYDYILDNDDDMGGTLAMVIGLVCFFNFEGVFGSGDSNLLFDVRRPLDTKNTGAQGHWPRYPPRYPPQLFANI